MRNKDLKLRNGLELLIVLHQGINSCTIKGKGKITHIFKVWSGKKRAHDEILNNLKCGKRRPTGEGNREVARGKK